MALLTFPDLITLIESIKVPNNGKVLSTPSPKEIFLTVKDEFRSLGKEMIQIIQTVYQVIFWS